MGGNATKGLGQGVEIAEASRDKEKLVGLMPDIFRGRLDVGYFDRISDSALQDARFLVAYAKMENFLKYEVDPEEIERTNEVPKRIIDWLSEEGYFGMKIPVEYGGMRLSQSQYMAILQLVATRCGAMIAMLSASCTIGVGWPIMEYGSPEQKQRWLPLVARSPSGFAFTEEKAGSDPSAMEVRAVRVRDSAGKITGYELTGRKWWTTNGPASDNTYLSKVIVVIGKIVEYDAQLTEPGYKPNFGAFIVPTDLPGFNPFQRCDFAGLRGIYNGITDFVKVFIPVDQLIGKNTAIELVEEFVKKIEQTEDPKEFLLISEQITELKELLLKHNSEMEKLDPKDRHELFLYQREGHGFKIALEALNSGRITIGGCCSAVAKAALEVERWWGNNRHQWGKQIDKHELTGTGKLAEGMADALAIEAMTWYAAAQADDHKDCRMEAATDKVSGSERLWKIIDDLVQVRGGRGYETAESLKKRGEAPLPVEKMFRDARPNRIFEGESSILGLFVVREGLEEYKARGEVFLEKGKYWQKFTAAVGFARDFAKLSLPNFKMRSKIKKFFGGWHEAKPLTKHMLYAEECSRRLAKAIIVASGKYQSKLPHKQLTLTRFFNIATEIYSIAAVCAYIMKKMPIPCRVELADFYCLNARRRLEREFNSLSDNSDTLGRKIAEQTINGYYTEWLKEGTISMVEVMKLKDDFVPPVKFSPMPKRDKVTF